MGREVKRVALDFNWPLHQVWDGFINHFYKNATKCPECGGGGYSPTAKRLQDQWYGNAPFNPEDRGSKPFLIDHPVIRKLAERNVGSAPEFCGTGERAILRKAQRLADHFNRSWSHHLNDDDVAALVKGNCLYDFTSTWTREDGWKLKDPPYIPTAKEVNEWSLAGFGHDSINCWIVVKAECERLGFDTACANCQGHGDLWESSEAKQEYDNWKPTEPPAGEGWQMWETTSEGSPISPVFATPQELARWLTTNATTFGDQKTSYESWLKMIMGTGWAPTMIMTNGEISSGVDFASGPNLKDTINEINKE